MSKRTDAENPQWTKARVRRARPAPQLSLDSQTDSLWRGHVAPASRRRFGAELKHRKIASETPAPQNRDTRAKSSILGWLVSNFQKPARGTRNIPFACER